MNPYENYLSLHLIVIQKDELDRLKKENEFLLERIADLTKEKEILQKEVIECLHRIEKHYVA